MIPRVVIPKSYLNTMVQKRPKGPKRRHHPVLHPVGPIPPPPPRKQSSVNKSHISFTLSPCPQPFRNGLRHTKPDFPLRLKARVWEVSKVFPAPPLSDLNAANSKQLHSTAYCAFRMSMLSSNAYQCLSPTRHPSHYEDASCSLAAQLAQRSSFHPLGDFRLLIVPLAGTSTTWGHFG